MSTRIKSAASNSLGKKAPPATTIVHPNVARSETKLTRNVSMPTAGNPAKPPSSRLLADVTKKTVVTSKPRADGQASKISVLPETLIKRVPKALDLQAQVNVLQEDLKNAMDKLGQVAKEKAQVVEEFKEAQKIAKETNEKLVEAVAVQKQAEEALEMEKLRGMEIEQSGIECIRIKEESWKKVIEDLRAELASNADALQLVNQEMIESKEELAELADAKNMAISQVDEKGKELKCYHDKVESLTAEISSLKALISSKTEAAENDANMVLGMKCEIESLKHELDKSLASEEKLEAKIKNLSIVLDESKMAQAHSDNLVNEWKQKVEELELRVEEANTNERSVLELLSSATKKFEEMECLQNESDQRKMSLMENIAHNEAAVDKLHIEVEACRDAEAKLRDIVEDWKQKAKELQKQVVEANLTEKTAVDSLSVLKFQLEETRGFLQGANSEVTSLTEKVAECEAALEQVNVQLEASRMAEAYANHLLKEWTHKVEELEDRVEEANCSERATKESLYLVQKELEVARYSSKEAEGKIDALEEKVILLEMSLEKQRGNQRQTEERAGMAEADALQMAKVIETLKIQLEAVQEEKLQALENEKLTASSVQSLLEEKSKLISDLENSQYEDEKNKKALESLAAALHEVSAEAREAKENFLARQAEHETYESQIDDLRCILKETNEKYEAMLDNAKQEVDSLKITIEKSKQQLGESEALWEKSKYELVNSVKQSEEDKSSLENEIKRVKNLVKEYEEGMCSAENDKAQLMKSLKDAESEVTQMQVVLGEAKVENIKLTENKLQNECELRILNHENEELRAIELAAAEKVAELSKLLEAAAGNKKINENGNNNSFLLIPEIEEVEAKHENHAVDSRLFESMREVTEIEINQNDAPEK